MLEEKNNLSMILQEKNDVEKKSNEVNNVEINNLKMNLDNIIVVLKTLFNKESQIYENRNNFLNKLSKLDMKRRIEGDGKVNYYNYGNVNNYDKEEYINNERRMGLNNNNFEI